MNNQSRMPYQQCLWAVALLIATSPVCAMLLSESQKIQQSDWRYCDYFGQDIAIDGDTALVSAFNGDCYTTYGKAYELSRSASGAWLESAKLTPPPEIDPEPGKPGPRLGFPTLSFGWAVALSGNKGIIGAPMAYRLAPEESSFRGRVFTLARSATGWNHEAIIDGDGAFGMPVAMDGNSVIIGRLPNDFVEIWARQAGAWVRQARIDVDDRGWPGDVALAVDGDTAVIGRTIYVRSGSVWHEQARLAAADGQPYDGLGASVALEDDVVVLGAPGVDREDVTNAGAAYVFRRSGNLWREEAKIVPTDSTSEFGAYVALDGHTVIIGGESRVYDQSAGYMYVRSDGAWRERATLVVSDDSRCFGDQPCYDRMGELAFSGDTVMIGWPGAYSPIVNSWSFPTVGAVYVFDLSVVDSDADSIADVADNCVDIANADQADFDGDGSGDACDPDIDGDAVANGADVCGYTEAGDTVHPDTGCSLAQRCPCDGPRASSGPWRNHGKYVSCVDEGARELSELGLIADAELEAIVSTVGRSACGFRDR